MKMKQLNFPEKDKDFTGNLLFYQRLIALSFSYHVLAENDPLIKEIKELIKAFNKKK